LNPITEIKNSKKCPFELADISPFRKSKTHSNHLQAVSILSDNFRSRKNTGMHQSAFALLFYDHISGK
jgi:hypothetical protein